MQSRLDDLRFQFPARAVFERMRAQSQRLQEMADELDRLRAHLNERKLIERAKGLLMAHQNVSEEQAYRTLRVRPRIHQPQPCSMPVCRSSGM